MYYSTLNNLKENKRYFLPFVLLECNFARTGTIWQNVLNEMKIQSVVWTIIMSFCHLQNVSTITFPSTPLQLNTQIETMYPLLWSSYACTVNRLCQRWQSVILTSGLLLVPREQITRKSSSSIIIYHLYC